MKSIITRIQKVACIILFLFICICSTEIYSEEIKLKRLSSEMITSGATLNKYIWHTTRKDNIQSIHANVIEVDLKNPNVKLDTMAGTNQQFTKKQNIVEMTNNTNAVAGINGDFYNMNAEGVPEGPQILNGTLIATPPKISGLYSFILNKDNTPIIDIYNFKGNIIANNGETFELGGINKTYYWGDNGIHSHIDSLFMYTHAWGSVNRSNDGVTFPSEILVVNDVIEYIGINEVIQTIPPTNGYILRATGKATDFVKKNLHVGEKIEIEQNVFPLDQSINDDPKTFKMMIGGNTLLVHEGKPTWYTRNIKSIDGYNYRARSAVGYSKDKDKVYLITVDNYGKSSGMSVSELQQFMIELGVWRGMVLDGGGSTQMAARPLGEFNTILVNNTENNSLRKIVNGIGVYSTAPLSELETIRIDGPKEVFVNQFNSFKVKGYDKYYNPVVLDKDKVTWTVDSNDAQFQNQDLIIQKPGTYKVKVQIGDISTEYEVRTILPEDISELLIQSASSVISNNEQNKFTVTAITKKGTSREVPNDLLEWEVLGAKGKLSEGIFTVDSIEDKYINIIAQYGNFKTMKTLPVGIDRIWYDLDSQTYLTYASPAIEGSESSVEIFKEGVDNYSLAINYDFTSNQSLNTISMKANFGSDKGIPIEGSPITFKLNIYGDNSFHKVYAEFQDANQKILKIKLVDLIDWNGWRTIQSNLVTYNMKYPIVLKNVAIEKDEQLRVEKLLKGQIRMDDLKFTYKSTYIQKPLYQVMMSINKNEITINNQKQNLSISPFMMEGKTMIPTELLVKSLGGKISWDSKERKITLLFENKLIEYWINQQEYNVNGKRMTSDVAPIIKGNRSFLPIRMISEYVGWMLRWDAKKQEIFLK